MADMKCLKNNALKLFSFSWGDCWAPAISMAQTKGFKKSCSKMVFGLLKGKSVPGVNFIIHHKLADSSQNLSNPF